MEEKGSDPLENEEETETGQHRGIKWWQICSWVSKYLTTLNTPLVYLQISSWWVLLKNLSILGCCWNIMQQHCCTCGGGTRSGSYYLGISNLHLQLNDVCRKLLAVIMCNATVYLRIQTKATKADKLLCIITFSLLTTQIVMQCTIKLNPTCPLSVIVC